MATIFLVQAPFDMTEVRKIGTLENVTPCEQSRSYWFVAQSRCYMVAIDTTLQGLIQNNIGDNSFNLSRG